MQIKKTLPHIKIKNIIGINENIIIHRNKNELIFFNYISRTVLKKTKTEGDEIFNCEFRDNNIFILSNSNFFIYNQPKNSIQDITLKNRATSKFLLENHNIYYGSKNREFIKLSINSNKVKWKFKIPKILKLKPRKAGKLITILPEDNNIYFFKKNGTMYWWEKLDSTRLLPPIVMKKNICVFLMPKSKPNIKFFNYEKKKVLSYKFQHQKRSNPIYINDYLYILSKEKKKPHTSVIRMGNKYGIKVNIDPEFVKPTGKSIQFDLEPINLIKPEFDIKILNEAEKNVFTKKMPSGFVPKGVVF